MLADTKILIKDACILFDLIDLGLLDCYFLLGIKTYTTPQVIGEVTDENQASIINGYIISGQLIINNSGTLHDIQTIMEVCPGLSFADCSVLELASRIDGIVISADNSLRKETLRRKLEVHGTLWIVEKLYEKQIIELHHAINVLIIYPEINSRTPKSEINKMVIRLKENM